MYLDKKLTREHLGPQIFSAVFLKILKKGQDEQERRVMLAKLVSADKFFAGGSLNGDRSHLLEVVDMSVLKKIQKDNGDEKRSWRSITLNLDESLAEEKGLLLELNVRGQDILPLIKLGKEKPNPKDESDLEAEQHEAWVDEQIDNYVDPVVIAKGA
tara:strand:+ start:128 stop:598 length:471 start_codon:yes stop_codon:yes gene_type:complete